MRLLHKCLAASCQSPSLIGCKLAPWVYVDPHPVCSCHASAYSSHSMLQLGCFLAQKAAICCPSLPKSGQTALGNTTALCCRTPLCLDAAASCIHWVATAAVKNLVLIVTWPVHVFPSAKAARKLSLSFVGCLRAAPWQHIQHSCSGRHFQTSKYTRSTRLQLETVSAHIAVCSAWLLWEQLDLLSQRSKCS